jgi:hypothetical protein
LKSLLCHDVAFARSGDWLDSLECVSRIRFVLWDDDKQSDDNGI